MTLEEKTKIAQLRRAGRSYTEIADELDVPRNTVKSYCQRNANPVSEPNEKPCLYCGKPVRQNPGRKEKKFCCDSHRRLWWNSHLDQVKHKAVHEYVCQNCGRTFSAYGSRIRKYCCHSCYVFARFGGAS